MGTLGTSNLRRSVHGRPDLRSRLDTPQFKVCAEKSKNQCHFPRHPQTHCDNPAWRSNIGGARQILGTPRSKNKEVSSLVLTEVQGRTLTAELTDGQASFQMVLPKRQLNNAVNSRHAKIILLSRGGIEMITWYPYYCAPTGPRKFLSDDMERDALLDTGACLMAESD